MPDKFFSFSGGEAGNMGKIIVFASLLRYVTNVTHVTRVKTNSRVLVAADCAWGFFRCTETYGTWPDNKVRRHLKNKFFPPVRRLKFLY